MAHLTDAQAKFLSKSTSTPDEAAIIRAAFQLANALAPRSLIDPTSAHRILTEACTRALVR